MDMLLVYLASDPNQERGFWVANNKTNRGGLGFPVTAVTRKYQTITDQNIETNAECEISGKLWIRFKSLTTYKNDCNVAVYCIHVHSHRDYNVLFG